MPLFFVETVDEKTPLIGSSDSVTFNKDQTITIEKEKEIVHSGSHKQNGGPPPYETHQQNGGPSTEKTAPVVVAQEQPVKKKEEKKKSICYTIFYSFIVLYKGWQTFMKYRVAFAGLGLATLYMTVLGFDNITVGKNTEKLNS